MDYNQEAKHENLPNKDVRTVIAKRLKEGDYMTPGQLDRMRKERQELDERIARGHKAVKAHGLMSHMGWVSFDTSDLGRYDKDTYYDFVGTEQEFREHLTSLGIDPERVL